MTHSKLFFYDEEALKNEVDTQHVRRLKDGLQWRSCLELQGIATERYSGDFKNHPVTAPYCDEMIAFGKNPMGNIMLSGSYGTGKTHVAVGFFASHMQFNGIGARFCKAEGIYREWTIKSRDGHLIDYLARLCDSPVLFIDDLGQGEITDSYKKFLYSIIDERWQAVRPTVVTTNLDAAGVSRLFGDAILSRLLDGKAFKFTGKDYRVKSNRDK